MKEKRNFYLTIALFVIGEIIVFGFISLLQFVSPAENLIGFIFTLIGMHIGIVAFIVSKKITKLPKDLRKHYIIEYIQLIPYIPFIIIGIAKVPIDLTLKYSLIFGYTGIAIVISSINTIFFIKSMILRGEEIMFKKKNDEKFKSLRICDNFY